MTMTAITIAATDPADPIRVLFLCTHNSARSQMAEGLQRHLGGDAFVAFSAGTEATRVHPLAIVVMREIGVDITGQRSKVSAQFYSRTAAALRCTPARCLQGGCSGLSARPVCPIVAA